MTLRLPAIVFTLALCTAPALAQRTYISRNYQPPSGEDPIAFGARLVPGMPVDEKPGHVWGHDGRGWYHELATTPTPNAPAPPPPPGTCPKVIANYYVLLTCASRPPTPINPWTGGTFSFEVGQLYGWPYPTTDRLLVVSVALDIDSLRRIVTGRRLKDGVPIGTPVTFFEDESGGWVPLP